MRAVVWDGTALSVTDELSVRDPQDGEVLVEVAAAGLCHSDLNPLDGAYSQPVPAVLGHEASGRVIAVGTGVHRQLVGARVVLSPIVSCGTCRRCRAGSPTTCTTEGGTPEARFSLGGEPVHQFVQLGAFAERTVVRAGQVVAIPDGIPDEAAALLGCAVVTGVGAVTSRARVTPGETVLVVGAGGIGLNAVQGARLAGADRIIVADRNPAKRALGEKLGATDFLQVATADQLARRLDDLVPTGVDAAIECTGNPELLAAAVDALARGGRAVIVGLPGPDDRVSLAVRALYHDKTLLGCRMGSVDPHDVIPELARRALAGDLVLEPLVTKVVSPNRVAELVEDLTAGRLDRGVISFAAP